MTPKFETNLPLNSDSSRIMGNFRNGVSVDGQWKPKFDFTIYNKRNPSSSKIIDQIIDKDAEDRKKQRLVQIQQIYNGRYVDIKSKSSAVRPSVLPSTDNTSS